MAEEPYEERTVQLAIGDRLVLYSDGIPEALSTQGEPFGNARFLESILRDRSLPLSDSVTLLLEDVQRWRGSRENAQDDLSILAIEVQPQRAPTHAGSKPLPMEA